MVKPIHHHLRNAFLPHEGNDFRPHALRHHWLRRYAVGLLVMKVLVVALVSFMAGPAWQTNVTSSAVVAQTNQARKERHIPTLRVSPALTAAAKSKAENMIQKQYFAHYSPQGTSPWFWFRQAGYRYRYAGENLAIDFVASEDLIAAWLKSPLHRQNLLSKSYKDIGVAIVNGEINGAQSLVVVQLFGTPISQVKKATLAADEPTANTTVATAVSTANPAPVAVASLPPAVPPTTPTITSPHAGSFWSSDVLEIDGVTTAGATVWLEMDGQPQSAATADSRGVFTVTFPQRLDDGNYQVRVRAAKGGLTSDWSQSLTVNIDTAAPMIDDRQTTVVANLFDHQGVDVYIKASDDTLTAECLCGPSAMTIPGATGQFAGYVSAGSTYLSGPLRFRLVDRAGNSTQLALVNPDFSRSTVMQSSTSSRLTATHILLYSRTFLMVFLAVMLLLAFVNVVHQWERRHHPTLIGSLLVIYLTGALLLL